MDETRRADHSYGDIVIETGLSSDYFNELQWIIGCIKLAKLTADEHDTDLATELSQSFDRLRTQGILPIKKYQERLEYKGYTHAEITERTQPAIHRLDKITDRINATSESPAPDSNALLDLVKKAALIIFGREYITAHRKQFQFFNETKPE